MAAVNRTRLIIPAILVAIGCVISAGCQSLDFGSAPTKPTAPVASANVIGQYQMQLIPARGKPSVEKINITGPVTVQDALETSGAIKKFGPMKITLGRIVKDKGQLLKLPVDYDVRSKTVEDAQNYGLLPGDTLTVSPTQGDGLQKLIEAASGGFM